MNITNGLLDMTINMFSDSEAHWHISPVWGYNVAQISINNDSLICYNYTPGAQIIEMKLKIDLDY